MTCPACGNQVAPDAHFCAVCGHRLVGRTEERRLVTVVFADLVGFTTLSERKDPEQIKHLVDRCFSWLAADIVSFGGRVDKVVGDAIVALFGAPTAHEDDAERAVRAALSMQATLRRRAHELDHAVQMRIGVNSGEVLVGEMQAAGDYTAMGDVVNTASRLETAAEPGEVLVGPNTYSATERVIRYKPRGLLVAKGREDPVDAYSAIEPAVAPGSRARSRVPMVGREAELELLRHAAGNALGHGRAALLLIAGDAGMGKTRLADELARWAAAKFATLSLEGRCLPYGEANVWWPIAEALRQAGKVELGMPLGEALASISAVVARDLEAEPDAPEVQRVAQGLVQVLGYDEARQNLDPASDSAVVEEAVVALLDAASRRQPVVLQLSDLHWADEVVLDLIDTVFERLPRHPLVLVATTRSSLLERWSPRAGRHDTVALNLDALNRDASSALLDSLATGDVVLDEGERERLIERAGGNPFFLEELVSLSTARVEAGSDLPGTLRGLLTARLDQLPAETRALVDDAAFIGRRGPLDALEMMALYSRGVDDIRPALEELAEADLLVLEDDAWSFRSDLLREVAYSTLTKHERARRHEEIASWLEDHLPPEVSDALVDQLANHWSTAAELGEELGTRPQLGVDPAVPALRWLEEAAERAERMRALRVAESLYDRALHIADLLPPDEVTPARRVDLMVGRARARAEERDFVGAQADVDEAMTLALRVGATAGEAGALRVAGDLANQLGRVDEAVTLLRRSAERFEQAGDLAGKGEALRSRALAEIFAGRLQDAERSGLAALEVFESIDDPRRKAWTLQNLAWVAFEGERVEEADRYLQESMALFGEVKDQRGVHWAEGLYAFVCLQRGDLVQAERLQTRVLQASRKAGDRWAVAMMLLLGSLLRLWSGRTETAVDESREALAIFEAMGDRYGRGRTSWTLGRALIMAGSTQEGLTLLESTVQVVRSMPGGEADEEFATGVLVAALAQLGEAERTFAAAGVAQSAFADPASLRLEELAPVAAGDRAIAVALAAVQLGQADSARAWLDRVPSKPSTRSVLALVAAAEGRISAAAQLASELAVEPGATYLDRLNARVAAALSAAAAGDGVAAQVWIEDLRTEVDATEDLLSKAVASMAEARVLRLLRDPGADAADARAVAAVRRHGAVGPGWAALFASIGT